MRKLKVVSLVLVGMSAGLSGCISTTRIVQKTQAPEIYRTASVETLQQEISERDAAIKTLKASVLITAATGGGKEGKVKTYTSFRGYIFVRKPKDLRVILQLPVIGSRALDMVSNGKTFTLMRVSSHGNVWMQGSDQVTKPSSNGLKNLRPAVFFDSLLVPGVKPDQFVTLTESNRVVQPETRHHDAIAEPDYELTVMRSKPGSPGVLQRLRTIHISRISMLPFQQDIYDDTGQIVTEALYSKYQPFGTEEFPMLITILRPQDEYSLKVDITRLGLNEPLEDDQFELKIPAGVAVQKME